MREVDEAVRQDELLGAARKYGVPAGIAVALALAAFGGWLFWSDHQDGAKEEQSELLVTALDKLDAGQVARANEELATVAAGEGGAAIAAQLERRAGIAHAVAAAYERDRERIRTVYRTIEREVAHVVERPVYRDCSVDADGLRLWSAANRGDPTPDAAGRAGR